MTGDSIEENTPRTSLKNGNKSDPPPQRERITKHPQKIYNVYI